MAAMGEVWGPREIVMFMRQDVLRRRSQTKKARLSLCGLRRRLPGRARSMSSGADVLVAFGDACPGPPKACEAGAHGGGAVDVLGFVQ